MTETKKNHKNKFLIFFSCVATAEKFWLIKRIVNLCAVVSVGLRILSDAVGTNHSSSKKKKTERFSHSLSHSKSQNERMRQAKTLEIFSGVQDVKFINLRLALHMAIIKLDVDKVNLKMESITQMNICTIRRCSFV